MPSRSLGYASAALVAAALLALTPWLGPARVAHAQASGPAKIRVEITDNGFKGVSGNFSGEGEGFTIAVEPGQEVELTFVWAHQAYVDDAHAFVLKGYGLETPEINAANREATLKFVANKAGTFDLKCDVHCEVHERLIGSLKVSRSSGTSASPAASAAAPSALSIRVPAAAELGQRVLLQARLLDGSGQPLARAPVIFSVPTSFLNKSSDVVVAKALTDKEGRAAAEYEVRSAGQLTIQADYRGNERYAPAKASAELVVGEAPRQLYTEHAGVRIPGLNAAPALGPTMVGLGQVRGPLAALSTLWPALSGWPIALALLVIWSSYAAVVVLTFRVAGAGSVAATVPARRLPAARVALEPIVRHGLWSGVALAVAIVVAALSIMAAVRGFEHMLADLGTHGGYLALIALSAGALETLVGHAPFRGQRWVAALGALGIAVALAALLSCCLWALTYRLPVVSQVTLALILNEVPVALAGLALSALSLVVLLHLRQAPRHAAMRPEVRP